MLNRPRNVARPSVSPLPSRNSSGRRVLMRLVWAGRVAVLMAAPRPGVGWVTADDGPARGERTRLARAGSWGLRQAVPRRVAARREQPEVTVQTAFPAAVSPR